MSRPAAILEFEKVTLPATTGRSALRAIEFQLCAGELMLVRVETGNEQLSLADAAEGLIVPNSGKVMIAGECWLTMPAEQELILRGRIGRVFDSPGWISNLNVLENLTLAQRHHTKRPVAEIIAEAQNLAQTFGLSEAPAVRPAVIPHRDLRRAEWIRAFMGQPMLILLERPVRGVAREHISKLIATVTAAQSRGAAVIWFYEDSSLEQAFLPQKSLRFHMRGDTMLQEAG